MTRDAGQGIDAGIGMQGNAEFGRRHGHCTVNGEREGRTAQFHRIDAEHEVMHDRVADQRHFQNRFLLDVRRCGHFSGQLAQGFAHGRRHLRRAARIHHRIRDAAHEVFAEADLRVHAPGGSHDFAAHEIAEVRRDRGRTDVDGETERRLMKSRPHRDDSRRVVHRHRDLPLSGAQGGLQLLQHREIAFEVLELPLACERQLEPLQVA